MTSISNLKIGKKIAAVLGGIILVLAGLSALSIWGTSANEKQSVTLIQRLTKARLAERIESDSTAIALDIERMIVQKRAASDLMSDRAEHAKSRAAAVEQFRALADSTTSIKHATDMADLV